MVKGEFDLLQNRQGFRESEAQQPRFPNRVSVGFHYAR